MGRGDGPAGQRMQPPPANFAAREFWSGYTPDHPGLLGDATWWIGMLLRLGYWRHVIRRFPLRYDPGVWSLVLPLGMNTTATFKLASAPAPPFLLVVPRVFIWLALTAWTIVFIGLLTTVATIASKFPNPG